MMRRRAHDRGNGGHDLMSDLTPNDFRWDGFFWKTTVRLDAWRGFQSGAYGWQYSAASSDGTVDVTFAPEGREEAPLREAEVELVRWAVRHEREMQNALMAALLPRYAALRADADYADAIEDERLMPPVRDVDGFRPLIGLDSLNVHQIEKAGRPYVGFEFGCTWDDEHGLGVLMHGERVVKIGGADTAILLWIARED